MYLPQEKNSVISSKREFLKLKWLKKNQSHSEPQSQKGLRAPPMVFLIQDRVFLLHICRNGDFPGYKMFIPPLHNPHY